MSDAPRPVRAGPVNRLRWTSQHGVERLLAERGPAQLAAVALVVVLLASPWAPLTALALLAYAAVTVRQPGLTVALLPLSAPFAYVPKALFGPRFPVVELLLVIALLTSALAAALRWRKEAATGTGAAAFLDAWDAVRAALGRPFGLQAAALAAIASLSLLTVADPLHRHESLREYRTVVVEPVAYYFLARYWLRDRALRALAVTAFLAGATAVALLAIGQVATGVHVVVAEGARRATSVYSHPNNLALYLARALPFALGLLLLSPNPLRQRRLLLATAILGAGLVLTFSRGALAGVAVALVALALLSGRRTLRVGILGAVVAAALLLPALAGSRLGSLAGGSLGLRRLIWSATLAMIRDHPAFGVGLDQFLYQYAPRYVQPAAWGERFTAHPHDLFLDFWVRLGIMGLAWVAWMLLDLATRVAAGWRRLGPTEEGRLLIAVGAACLAAVAHGLIDNFYFLIDLAFAWWLLLALVAVTTGAAPDDETGLKAEG